MLSHGDPAGAIVKLQAASAASPEFADPPELWGEALMQEGDAAGALAHFEQAGRDAPAWGRNHLRWGEALAKLGRRSEAMAQWRQAQSLDLSPAERGEPTYAETALR